MCKVERITQIQKNFSFIYLGCPIFYEKRKKCYYDCLVDKVSSRLKSWQGKMLSFRGRAILISHVLQTMPIHLLSAVYPLDSVINQLRSIFANFFLRNSQEDSCRHWASRKALCLPMAEGGMGFRSLFDIFTVLFCKLWWNFRSRDSLRRTYMANKYCKKIYCAIVPYKEGSYVWRKMLQAHALVNHEIYWQPRARSSHLWYDNRTSLGP